MLITPDGRVAHAHNSREFCVASQWAREAELIVTLRPIEDR